MKFKDAGSSGSMGGRKAPPGRVGNIRMEWMDPLSWRLPSGKALAEFALQSGFLAPLMLVGTPKFKKRKRPVSAGAPVSTGLGSGIVEKRLEEVPGQSGSFRETK